MYWWFCGVLYMWKQWRFACVVLAAVQVASLAVAQQVVTESGTISGVSESGSSVYKGVPFAAAPVGDLRWRPPVRVASWKGTRKADAFAPACMQDGVSMPGETPPKVSEDCLYLNIWAPAKSAKERLPVIVWIYGGGFISGSASMSLYWGDRLAHKGVIAGAKVQEEAEEVVRAAREESDERVVEEAADVLYHVAVLLRGRGLTLADAERVLDGRRQR